VEAALTLKLHSDLHEWDLYTFVPPMEDLGLPQQSQFHRKETLCLLILDYLGNYSSYTKCKVLTSYIRQRKGVRKRHRNLQRVGQTTCRGYVQLVRFWFTNDVNITYREPCSARLAEILRHEATLLEHIIMDQRYYPDYFRVAFWGDFPDALRGKHFIVRHYFILNGIKLTVHLSIEDTSGKDMVPSANACLTSTLVLNY